MTSNGFVSPTLRRRSRVNDVRCSCLLTPGGYTATHPVIETFWEVVEGFTDEEKRKLLLFVTSCSRPPLFGFKVNSLLSFLLSSSRSILVSFSLRFC